MPAERVDPLGGGENKHWPGFHCNVMTVRKQTKHKNVYFICVNDFSDQCLTAVVTQVSLGLIQDNIQGCVKSTMFATVYVSQPQCYTVLWGIFVKGIMSIRYKLVHAVLHLGNKKISAVTFAKTTETKNRSLLLTAGDH